AAAADPSRSRRARGQPSLGVGAPARGRENRGGTGLMEAVDWFAQAEVAEPAPAPRRQRPAARRPARSVRPRPTLTHRRVRGNISGMILLAPLLFGGAGVTVAAPRAHVAVSRLDDERAGIEARNQALASALSAATSAPRIEAGAHRLGLIQASAGNTSYLDMLGRR